MGNVLDRESKYEYYNRMSKEHLIELIMDYQDTICELESELKESEIFANEYINMIGSV